MPTRLLTSALFTLLVSACNSTDQPMAGDDLGSAPIQEEGESVALSGGLTFDDVTAFAVAYHQADASCSRPRLAWLEVGYDASYPRLDIQLPFDATLPGTYLIGSHVNGAEGEETTRWEVQASIATTERSYGATSGQIQVAIDGTVGEARLDFTDLIFDGYDTALHSGSATLDLVVACKPVTREPSGACVWELESPPYESAYCADTMSGYAPDVLL